MENIATRNPATQQASGNASGANSEQSAHPPQASYGLGGSFRPCFSIL